MASLFFDKVCEAMGKGDQAWVSDCQKLTSLATEMGVDEDTGILDSYNNGQKCMYIIDGETYFSREPKACAAILKLDERFEGVRAEYGRRYLRKKVDFWRESQKPVNNNVVEGEGCEWTLSGTGGYLLIKGNNRRVCQFNDEAEEIERQRNAALREIVEAKKELIEGSLRKVDDMHEKSRLMWEF